MSNPDEMEDKRFIFGSLLVVANRMETLLERELKEFDATVKQWFLSLIVDNVFNEPPTIKEAAKQMGSSHQNVKQVALKLQQKGLLKLEKDKRDARITRLSLTENSRSFWQKTEPKGTAFMKTFYTGIDDDDLAGARAMLKRMLANLDEMEETENFKEKGEIV